MPLSWNEIRSRAHDFSRRWAGEASERAEAQSFWNDFFAVFGIERKRVAIFEKQVQIARAGEKLKHGRIDAFWKGMLLIEHKSRGADLDRAFAQAADYFEGLPERDLPRYILVSDFERFRLYDLEENSETEFKLTDLHKRIKHFAFIAGYRTQVIAPQNPVNIKAAERMGRLHDRLKASGYEGHPLEVLLVRLLFCLFAEDTGIFQPAGAFKAWLDERTAPDGSDLGAQLAQFFQVLNTPEDKRSKNLDEQLAAFPYVNGKLFEETLPIAAFDAAMREALLDCTALDWSAISPAIFGALFQSIMDDRARRTSVPITPARKTSSSSSSRCFSMIFGPSSRKSARTRTGCSSSTKSCAPSPSSTPPAAAATSWSSPTASCARWSWKSCAPATIAPSRCWTCTTSSAWTWTSFTASRSRNSPPRSPRLPCGSWTTR